MQYDDETIKCFLISAALDETELVCDYVESHGVWPDATWGGKPTALCYAALHGNAWLARFLLDRGADADHRDALEMTPLHYAALGCCERTGRLLLSDGANPLRRNRFGKIPADLLPARIPGPRRRTLVDLYRGAAPIALVHRAPVPVVAEGPG